MNVGATAVLTSWQLIRVLLTLTSSLLLEWGRWGWGRGRGRDVCLCVCHWL